MHKYILLLLLIFFSFGFSQTRIIEGVVSDTLGVFLQNASVMATPSSKEVSLKFAIADDKGRYKLLLESKYTYTVSVSYIGFIDKSFVTNSNDNITSYNFKLTESAEKLKDIIINYKVKPIIIKEDTLTYNVKNFTNGNERKLKDQLKKLPGISVDKNGGIYIQGQRVTNTLVEGKSFFGGGSKIAVENIPADAVEKIEIISHFNDVSFLKNVSGSNKIALNIKLKKDKKKFVFGDLDAGSGPLDFYKLHTALFYYSPNTTFGYIGDSNNIASSALDFSDVIRLEGGVSEFLSPKKSSSLYDLYNNNLDIFKNKTRFSAIDFLHQLTKKTEVSGYVLFSKTLNIKNQTINTQYTQNDGFLFQNNINNSNLKSKYFVGNFKLKYSPNKNEIWKYNSNVKFLKNNIASNIDSKTNNYNSIFETTNDFDDMNFDQFLEWHKSYSTKHTTSIVANQVLDINKQNNNWLTNNVFLSKLLPLLNDSYYNVNQTGSLKRNETEFLFKNYWIINNYNHIYVLIGNNYKSIDYQKNEKQFLTSGAVSDFKSFGFGNELNYTYNRFYLGIEYKFIVGKLTNKLSLFNNINNQKTTNFLISNSLKNNLITPKLESEYKFSNAHTIQLNYESTNQFPEYNQLANRFILEAFNAVYKGNEQLKNEQFHTSNLFYKKNDVYHGLMINGMINYTYKIKSIRNAVIIDDGNLLTTSILQTNPENNFGFRGNVTKNINQFILGLNTSLSFNNYYQFLDTFSNNVKHNSKDIGLVLKTNNTKWPFVTASYNKFFDVFNGINNLEIISDKFSIDIDYEINKNLVFKTDGTYQINKNSLGQSNYSQLINSALEYKQVNSPWFFELSAKNLLDNGKQTTNSSSDYMISYQTTYILPRVIMLSISYKL
jgi:hypothetical protein